VAKKKRMDKIRPQKEKKKKEEEKQKISSYLFVGWFFN